MMLNVVFGSTSDGFWIRILWVYTFLILFLISYATPKLVVRSESLEFPGNYDPGQHRLISYLGDLNSNGMQRDTFQVLKS